MWTTIGQKRALVLLENSIKNGRVSHAYLFVGPAHVGKMTLARDLAMALNCHSDERPCNSCSSCLRIASGSHADLQVLSLGKGLDGKAQTEIGIDDVRRIQHSASLPPFEGDYRVFIIDGAEALSSEAANCLLKTLEEPVGKTVFILLTAKEDSVLSTVSSRCQRIEVVPTNTSEIEGVLVHRGERDLQRAKLVAHLSHGCLGWAFSALNDSSLEAHQDCVDEIAVATTGGLSERLNYVSTLATEFSQGRETVYDKLALWVEFWRDVLLVKAETSDLVSNVNRLDILSELAASLEISEIRASIENVNLAVQNLKQNANARLALEVLALRLPSLDGKIAVRVERPA
jgi:DNA polymerase III subunit delta'